MNRRKDSFKSSKLITKGNRRDRRKNGKTKMKKIVGTSKQRERKSIKYIYKTHMGVRKVNIFSKFI